MSSILDDFEISSNIPENIKIKIKSFHVFNDYWFQKRNILVVTTNDRVFGLGNNNNGSLGLGHSNEVEECTEIKDLLNKNIIEFINGKDFVLAKNEREELFGWGRNHFGQLGRTYKSENCEVLAPGRVYSSNLSGIKDICCGSQHSLVLLSDGQLYSWGSNEWQQLGFRYSSENNKIYNKPTKIIIKGTHGLKIEYIYCCNDSSFAITIDRKLFSWGLNSYGMLGQGVEEEVCLPKQIDLSGVLKICSNRLNTYFLTKDGIVYFCGKYRENKYELNQLRPSMMNDSNSVIYDLARLSGHNDQVFCLQFPNSCFKLVRNKQKVIKECFESLDQLLAKRYELTAQTLHVIIENPKQNVSVDIKFEVLQKELQEFKELFQKSQTTTDSKMASLQEASNNMSAQISSLTTASNETEEKVKQLIIELSAEKEYRKTMEQTIAQLQDSLTTENGIDVLGVTGSTEDCDPFEFYDYNNEPEDLDKISVERFLAEEGSRKRQQIYEMGQLFGTRTESDIFSENTFSDFSDLNLDMFSKSADDNLSTQTDHGDIKELDLKINRLEDDLRVEKDCRKPIEIRIEALQNRLKQVEAMAYKDIDVPKVQ